MDKKKQIEEMAKDMLEYGMEKYPTGDSVFTETKLREQFYHVFLTYAEHLIQKGYRKVQENAVVLTREEYEELDKCRWNNEKVADILLRFEKVEARIRKETAEKFAELALKEIKSISAKSKDLLEDESVYEDSSLENVLEKVKNEICKEILEKGV